MSLFRRAGPARPRTTATDPGGAVGVGMSLADISIRNPVFAWMLMFGLMIFGWISFARMGVSLMPDVDSPVLTVSLNWEGASPEVMEAEVLDVVEDALTSVEGIKEMSSTARRGSGSVTIELDLERNVDVALQSVQAKLAQAQRRLPRDMDPPVVSKQNPEDQPIMFLGLSGDVPMPEIMDYARNVMRPRFQSVPGVGEVFMGGYVDRNLRIWIDAGRLAAMQLTVEDVLAAIRRQHAEMPAGTIETKAKEFNVRTLGEFTDPVAFGGLLITHRGGQRIHVPIPLRQVARIEDGLADIRRISRVNGVRAVGLGIRKQRGVNAVAVARAVKARMAEAQKDLPPGYTLGVNFDTTRFIEESVHDMNFHLIIAAVLTSLVCWAFLGSWSSTFNILLAIPTSVLGTFIVTYFAGFTLNTFTLLGLTLSIGIVVDDAIMVLENIVRHRELGQGKVEGARKGAREITFAALAATVSILAIFLPVVFMEGLIGKYFFQFGVTLSAAVSFSLLEALTLTPMRCAQYLDLRHEHGGLPGLVDRGMKAWGAAYARHLGFVVERRWLVVAGSMAIFAVSLVPAFAGWIRRELIPAQDQGRFIVRIQTPVGSSMEFTDGKFREGEALIKDLPAVNLYFSAVGGFGGGEVNAGNLFVTLKPIKERPKDKDGKRPTQQQVMASVGKMLRGIPGVSRAAVQDPSQSGFGGTSRGFPVEVSVRGPDWEKLVVFSRTLEARMESAGLMTDVNTDYQSGMPEVRVLPNRQSAYARGVSVDAIGTVINAMVGGIRAGYITREGRRYDVRLRAEAGDRIEVSDIGRYFVRNASGEMVRLSDVVRVEERDTLLSITRKNRERAIGLSANVLPGKSQAEALAATTRIAKEVLPDGYRVVFTGAAATAQESGSGLMFALIMGIVVAYMVLGSQFNSFIHPVSVLLALPFSVTGALLVLWATGYSLNMYSMIGLILLMGIVKKNSILLVDFINHRRREGVPLDRAIREACPVRLRPIVMTSVSTIAAALPSAISTGPGSETRAPMAIAVIGGVVVSTVLSLYVVPAAYRILTRFEAKR